MDRPIARWRAGGNRSTADAASAYGSPNPARSFSSSATSKIVQWFRRTIA